MPTNKNGGKIGYPNTNINLGTDSEPDLGQIALDDLAFMTSRLFGGPIMMRDEIDPLITADTSGGGHYSIGRTTAQTLGANPTIISMSPGKAVFLPFSSGLGKLGLISDALTGMGSSLMSTNLLSGNFKGLKQNKMFYTIGSAYNDYINHVNMIARMMSIYIGIGDEEVPFCNDLFKEYDWAHYYENEDPNSQRSSKGDYHKKKFADDDSKNEEFSWSNEDEELFSQTSVNEESRDVFGYYGSDPEDTVFGANTYIHFYANSNTSYDESTSTSTRASSIQSQFEGVFSDTVKDIQFLFGGTSNEDGILADVNSLFSNLADATGGIADFAKAASNYLKGGRLVFPQMVDGTTYSKSINVGLRFTSPYGDPISVFLYCMLPLAHIMAFSFPKQLDNNMYTYPFLVSCYSRGFINCDMGVVTSVRIARGGQDDSAWSASGLATDIEVNMEITPLHNELMISSSRHPILFLQNYGLQEYLGTICGVDMKGDTVLAQLNVIGTLFKNWAQDTPSNILRGMQDWFLNSYLGQIYQGITRLLTLP